MKGTCTIIASVAAAASTVALSSSSSATSGHPGITSSTFADRGKSVMSQVTCLEKGKFAPKFDGLRFIETLVTAHR